MHHGFASRSRTLLAILLTFALAITATFTVAGGASAQDDGRPTATGVVLAGTEPVAGVLVEGSYSSDDTTATGAFTHAYEAPTGVLVVSSDQTAELPQFEAVGDVDYTADPLEVVLPELGILTLEIVGSFYPDCSYNGAIVDGCNLDIFCDAIDAAAGACDAVDVEIRGVGGGAYAPVWSATGYTEDGTLELPVFLEPGASIFVTTIDAGGVEVIYDGTTSMTIDLGGPAPGGPGESILVSGNVSAGGVPQEGVEVGFASAETDANGDYAFTVAGFGGPGWETLPFESFNGPVFWDVQLPVPEVTGNTEINLELPAQIEFDVVLERNCSPGDVGCAPSNFLVQAEGPFTLPEGTGYWSSQGTAKEDPVAMTAFDTSTVLVSVFGPVGVVELEWDGSDPFVVSIGDLAPRPLRFFYLDADGDGFGGVDAEPVQSDFWPGPPFVENNRDCDDDNGDINPNAFDVPENGIDEDCDGVDAIEPEPFPFATGVVLAGVEPLAGVEVLGDFDSDTTNASGEFTHEYLEPFGSLIVSSLQTATIPSFDLFSEIVYTDDPLEVRLPATGVLELEITGSYYPDCSYNEAIVDGCVLDEFCDESAALAGECDEAFVEIYGEDAELFWSSAGSTSNGTVDMPVFFEPGAIIYVNTIDAAVYEFIYDGSAAMTVDLGGPAETTVVSGVVTAGGVPQRGVRVEGTGAVTNARGEFSFSTTARAPFEVVLHGPDFPFNRPNFTARMLIEDVEADLPIALELPPYFELEIEVVDDPRIYVRLDSSFQIGTTQVDWTSNDIIESFNSSIPVFGTPADIYISDEVPFEPGQWDGVTNPLVITKIELEDIEVSGTVFAGSSPLEGVDVNGFTTTNSAGEYAVPADAFDPFFELSLTGNEPAFYVSVEVFLDGVDQEVDVILPEIVDLDVQVNLTCEFEDLLGGCEGPDFYLVDIFGDLEARDEPSFGQWSVFDRFDFSDGGITIPVFDQPFSVNVYDDSFEIQGSAVWDGSNPFVIEVVDPRDPRSDWFPDTDGDGFGDDAAEAVRSVDQPGPTFVDNNLDCDDGDSGVSPDAIEVPDNGIDDDCDGVDERSPVTISGVVLAGDVPIEQVVVNGSLTDATGSFSYETLANDEFHELFVANYGSTYFEATVPLPTGETDQEVTIEFPELIDLEIQIVELCGDTPCAVQPGHFVDLFADPVVPGATFSTWQYFDFVLPTGANVQAFAGDMTAVVYDDDFNVIADVSWDGSNPFVITIDGPEDPPATIPTISVGDYVIDGEDGTMELIVSIDPAGLPVSAFSVDVTYDPEVVKPLLIDDPGLGVVGAPICTSRAGDGVFCGPLNPTNTISVGALNRPFDEPWTEKTAVIAIPFAAQGAPGESPILLSITSLIDLSGADVSGIVGDGRVEVLASPTPVVVCLGSPVTIDMRSGASGVGTDGDDVILGTSGDDVIKGLGGNDKICAGGGDDVVNAGAGDDMVIGGAGADKMYGAGGNDDLRGWGGDDLIRGGGGRDKVAGGAGNDDIEGGSGDDELRGQAGDDFVNGNRGADLLVGGAGADELVGGPDNDTLRGGLGDDELRGQAGDDLLVGGMDNDALFGGTDDDRLVSGSGIDRVFGGPGTDSCADVSATDTVGNCETRVI